MSRSKKRKKPQQRRQPQQKKPQRPRRTYNTPGRECAHADKGCCAKCIEPMAPAKSHFDSHFRGTQ